MKEDYSNSRMTDYECIEEYKNKLGKEKFDAFLNMVYKWLMDLEPGQSIDIATHTKITSRNRDLFIKVACLFISEGNSNYTFSEDFTQIKNNSSYVLESRKPKKTKNLEQQRKGVPV